MRALSRVLEWLKIIVLLKDSVRSVDTLCVFRFFFFFFFFVLFSIDYSEREYYTYTSLGPYNLN